MTETLADIIREMREKPMLVGDTQYVFEPHILELANRIEVAYKREKVNDSMLALGTINLTNEKWSRYTVAMHDALKEMQTRLVAGIHDGSLNCYEALEIVESALAEGGAQ